MSQANPSARKLPIAELRRAAQQLSASAKRCAPTLAEQVAGGLGSSPLESTRLAPKVASIGELRRTMAARLEAAVRLPQDPRLLPAMVLDALDLTVILRDERFDEGLARLVEWLERDPSADVIAVADYAEYPTYAGVDLLVQLRDLQGPDPKARLRLRTPGEAAELLELPALLESIHALRPRAERVAADFGEAEDLEVYYFAELLPELGFDLSAPAGLYCLLTTEAAQVACYWSADGWRPSAEVEAWIVGAEPSLEPLDGEQASEILASWSGRPAESRDANPSRRLAGRRG